MATAHTGLIAKADLSRAFDKWLVYLTTERQLAEKTREAYTRDLTYFLGFLARRYERLAHAHRERSHRRNKVAGGICG